MPAAETLLMGNNLKEIHQMTGFVERFAEEHQLPHSDVFALTLCLEELITNTISYGYPQGGTHELALELSLSGDVCRAVLADDGIPFNPLDRPEVDTSVPLEEKPIGGLGIHLVKKMMNQLDYERRDGRNILTLYRKIGQESPPENNPC